MANEKKTTSIYNAEFNGTKMQCLTFSIETANKAPDFGCCMEKRAFRTCIYAHNGAKCSVHSSMNSLIRLVETEKNRR